MIKVTRLLTNQFIIGKTEDGHDKIKISNPYTLVPDPMGIQMFPLDEAIIGNKIKDIEVDVSNVLYSETAGLQLKETYLESVTGIELPKKEIIV